MTHLRVTSRNQLDDTVIEANVTDLLNELNVSAAKGHHFIYMQEPDGSPVLLETRNITRVRVVGDDDLAFIGRN
jgi:predicted double-glycine peptidase